jgi:hypothetical protein
MNTRKLLIIAIAVLIIVGALGAVVLKRQNDELVRLKTEAEAKVKAEATASDLAAKLISTDSRFAVYTTSTVSVTHYNEGRAPYCAHAAPHLNALVKAGYIDLSPWEDWYCGNITSKGTSAMGKEIKELGVEQRIVSGPNNIREDLRWRLILAYREFVQIDGTTPLTNGQRVDFSWRWRPTDIGKADGVIVSAQRGEAYLRKSGDSFVIDKMYFKAEQQ